MLGIAPERRATECRVHQNTSLDSADSVRCSVRRSVGGRCLTRVRRSRAGHAEPSRVQSLGIEPSSGLEWVLQDGSGEDSRSEATSAWLPWRGRGALVASRGVPSLEPRQFGWVGPYRLHDHNRSARVSPSSESGYTARLRCAQHRSVGHTTQRRPSANDSCGRCGFHQGPIVRPSDGADHLRLVKLPQ